MTMKKLIFTIGAVTCSIFAFAQATLSAGPDQTICGGTSAILAANAVADDYWTVVSGPNTPVFLFDKICLYLIKKEDAWFFTAIR